MKANKYPKQPSKLINPASEEGKVFTEVSYIFPTFI